MSVKSTLLRFQRYIHELTGTSVLAIIAEMAGYFLLEYMSQYAFATILVFLLFCVLPIHFATHTPWTAARIRRYLAYMFKLYLYAILIYLLICLPFSYITFSAPNSRFKNSVTKMRECAYRFEESECTTQSSSFYGKIRGVDRECFALAMCLRQPILLLQIFFFIQELLATFLGGQGFEFFCFFMGTFVVWAMGSGWWEVPQVENASGPLGPTQGPAPAATVPAPPPPPPPPPPPTPPAPPAPRASALDTAEPVVEPAIPQNGHGIQLNGDPIPEVGANLAPPARNGVFSPPLFEHGDGGLPRPVLRPVLAHPNPLAQNPIPDIPIPGPAAAYRVGQPTLPMVNVVVEQRPQEPLPEWQRNDHFRRSMIRRRPELGDDLEDPSEEVDRMRDQIEAMEEALEEADAEIYRGSDEQSWMGGSQEEFIVEYEDNEGGQEVRPPHDILLHDGDGDADGRMVID